jgi:hypothetical protein
MSMADKRALIISMIGYTWGELDLERIQPILGSRGLHATSRVARSTLGFQALPNQHKGENVHGALMIDLFGDVKIARLCVYKKGVLYRAFPLNFSTAAILREAKAFKRYAYLFRDNTSASLTLPDKRKEDKQVTIDCKQSKCANKFDFSAMSDQDLANFISEAIKVRDDRVAKIKRIYNLI